MSCPICGCYGLDCECRQEAVELRLLREQPTEQSTITEEQAEESEYKELFKQVCVAMCQSGAFYLPKNSEIAVEFKSNLDMLSILTEAILEAANNRRKNNNG